MAYTTEPIPYRRPCDQMTDGALKKAFASVMESMNRRVDRISRHLYDAHGLKITATSPDEDVDRMSKFISDLGGLWNPKRLISSGDGTDENELQAIAILGHPPGLTLTPETVEMVFDGALLWGEVFRHRYPEAKWAIGGKPRSSIDYGDPVLIGPYENLSEFGVRGQLFGAVGLLLFRLPNNWTLSALMRQRAFDLGLAPDPRRRVMP